MNRIHTALLALALGTVSSAASPPVLDLRFGWQGGAVMTGGGQDSLIAAVSSGEPFGTTHLLSRWSGASAAPDGGLSLLELREDGLLIGQHEVFRGCATDRPQFCVGSTLRGKRGVLIAGNVVDPSGNSVVSTVLRWSEGQGDPRFGREGYAPLPRFGDDGPSALLERSDGRLWVVGRSLQQRWQVARLLENGQPDLSLNRTGSLELSVGGDAPRLLLERPDGALLLLGSHAGNLRAAQIRPDGSLDPRFGSGGVWNGPDCLPLEGRFNSGGFVVLCLNPTASPERFRPALLRVQGANLSPSVTRFDTEAEVASLDRRGFVWTARGGSALTVERFTPDGRRNTAFGQGGRATLPSAFAQIRPQKLLEQDEGKMLLMGTVSDAGGAMYTSVDLFALRLNR